MFGSAIFIFTLFNITVLSFFPFICDRVVINQDFFFFFVSKYVISTYAKSFLEVLAFSLSLAFSLNMLQVWNLFFFHLRVAHSSLALDHFCDRTDLYTKDWPRNTTTRTYRNWTWGMLTFSLIIFVLCCFTCANTHIILTKWCTLVCFITLFSYGLSFWLVSYNFSNGPQNGHMVVDL